MLWCGGAHRSADFLSGQSNRKCEPCSTVHDDRHVTVVFLAMYEKDSQPLEVVVEHFIQTKFVRPKVRPYQTDNYYDALMRQYKLEKEVERIVFQKEATGKKHQNACKSESEAAARN